MSLPRLKITSLHQALKMVIQDYADSEFTSYVRFVDNENKELAFYDIEQEMGDPQNIETVGAVMQILNCGYTL